MRHLGDPDSLEADVSATGMGEEPGAVTEQDRGDYRQHLVELSRLKTLSGDVGAQHVHIPVAGRGLGGGEALLDWFAQRFAGKS